MRGRERVGEGPLRLGGLDGVVGLRIAVLGSGVCGIAAARTLGACGHDVVVFERSGQVGGVWATAYGGVRLQNEAEQYHLADFPWPFPVDRNPTGEQVLRYLEAAVDHFAIDVRLCQDVVEMVEGDACWTLRIATADGEISEAFDFVVLAVGLFSEDRVALDLPGRDTYRGTVLFDRDVKDPGVLTGRVAVAGFGKSAVDMAAFAAARGASVHHVFRDPRWLIPRTILGVRFSTILFARMSTAFIPAWAHPGRFEAFLHHRLGPLVNGFWSAVTGLIRVVVGLHPLWRDRGARARMRALVPAEAITFGMRSAVAVAPDDFYPLVRSGRIQPERGTIMALYDDGIELGDGRRIGCDMVVVSLGCGCPRFPFLPSKYRELLEADDDGVQLYRHLVHPDIPRVAFAGFNHGFLSIPLTEVGMVWVAALLRGDLLLPSREVMDDGIAGVRDWKRAHMLFEPTRSCAVNTRFQQYLDVLLGDLGLDPRRKGSRLGEIMLAYKAADYAGMIDEYERVRRPEGGRLPLPILS